MRLLLLVVALLGLQATIVPAEAAVVTTRIDPATTGTVDPGLLPLSTTPRTETRDLSAAVGSEVLRLGVALVGTGLGFIEQDGEVVFDNTDGDTAFLVTLSYELEVFASFRPDSAAGLVSEVETAGLFAEELRIGLVLGEGGPVNQQADRTDTIAFLLEAGASLSLAVFTKVELFGQESSQASAGGVVRLISAEAMLPADPIPLPASGLLMLTALAGAVGLRRRGARS
jgi:hypothetical protein